MSSILPLRLDKVCVQKRGKQILKSVSLEIAPSGVTIVMGPNGSGKTTLLRVMHGLEKPRTGTLSWNVAKEEAQKRQAFVFQTPILMRRSVIENIAYPLHVQRMAKSDALNKANQWVKDIGLDKAKDLDAQNLSGGEQQKLAIARALICEPDVLFLDEPTTNLDGKSTREIETLLRSAGVGGTRIIMTTHDLGQAKRLASDIVFLNNGELCEHSPAEQFFKRAQSPQAQAYLKGDIVE